jgi:hypothetical protein
MESWVEKLIVLLSDMAARYSARTGNPTSALKMVDILPKLCGDCERLGGSADNWLDIVK